MEGINLSELKKDDGAAIKKIKDLASTLSKEGKKEATNFFKNSETIEERIKKVDLERKKLENESFRGYIEQQEKTLRTLFSFLKWETIAIFVIGFLQGFKFIGFHLNEQSFQILSTATIIQITVMLKIAISYLFPRR